MWSAFLHFFGIEPRTPSTAYNFWSGFGSDISEFAIFYGVVSLFRSHNCHVKGCLRLSHHQITDPDKGVTHNVCHKHHPTRADTVTAAMVVDAHARSQRENAL